MALSERIKERPETMAGKPCSVGVLIAQLDPKELAALRVMLGTPEKRGWSEGEIYDALTAEGYEVARQSINRHRGGRCRCKASA
jgi:hypothetical protein